MGGLTVFGWYFPSLLALSLISLSLVLPEHLADYRQRGILRRIGTTPVPPAWMLAAQVAVNLALAVAALVILVVAGTVGFGLDAPGHLGGFTLTLVLSVAAIFAIGLWISAIARTSGAAQGIGQLLLWPLLFCGHAVPPAVLAGCCARHRRLDPIRRGRAGVDRLHGRHLPLRTVAVGPGRLGAGVRVSRGAVLPMGVTRGARTRDDKGMPSLVRRIGLPVRTAQPASSG